MSDPGIPDFRFPKGVPVTACKPVSPSNVLIAKGKASGAVLDQAETSSLPKMFQLRHPACKLLIAKVKTPGLAFLGWDAGALHGGSVAKCATSPKSVRLPPCTTISGRKSMILKTETRGT